jgi:hypothetical protein
MRSFMLQRIQATVQLFALWLIERETKRQKERQNDLYAAKNTVKMFALWLIDWGRDVLIDRGRDVLIDRETERLTERQTERT